MPINWIYGEKMGQTEFVGLVLEAPVYHAQAGCPDWEYRYARVWDLATGKPRDIAIGIDAYGNGSTFATVVVDADDHVNALYDDLQHDIYVEDCRRCNAKHQVSRLTTPLVGRRVRIVRGRKYPKGTEGYVAWSGEGHFGPQVLLQVEQGRIYVSEQNVAVILTHQEYEQLVSHVKYLYGDISGIYAREHLEKAVQEQVTVSV